MTIEIQKDLQKGLTIGEVCEKYKISFEELFARLKNPPKQKAPTLKCICQVGTRYLIQKNIDGKINRYGSYMSLKEAIQVKNELDELNWEANPQDYNGDMYIHKHAGKYTVNKSNGRNKTIYFGKYHTLEDARRVRDCLVKVNWDKTYLKLILKKLGVEKIGDN